jgi:hypothetical protein
VSLPLQVAIGALVVLAVFTLLVHTLHRDPPHPPPVAVPDPPRSSPAREPEDPRRQFKASADPLPLDEAGRRHLEDRADALRRTEAIFARARAVGLYPFSEDSEALLARIELREEEARRGRELQKKLLL